MKTFLFLLFLALQIPAMAGSADALIQGKTESGRTTFVLNIGDLDGLVRSLELTVDGKSYSVHESDITFQSVVRDQKNGIYVITFQTASRKFRLWMIPKTEKVTEKGNGVYRSRFAAVLEATDPRKTDGSFTPRITIGCRLDYEI